jgi:hypothetical protein
MSAMSVQELKDRGNEAFKQKKYEVSSGRVKCGTV